MHGISMPSVCRSVHMVLDAVDIVKLIDTKSSHELWHRIFIRNHSINCMFRQICYFIMSVLIGQAVYMILVSQETVPRPEDWKTDGDSFHKQFFWGIVLIHYENSSFLLFMEIHRGRNKAEFNSKHRDTSRRLVENSLGILKGTFESSVFRKGCEKHRPGELSEELVT